LSEFDLNGSKSDNFIRGEDREPATEFESQSVLNDSGGAMFFKEKGEWVLGGVILAVSGFRNQPEAATTAIYGNATFYADIATYREQIVRELALPGDFDGDGFLTVDDVNLLAKNLGFAGQSDFDLDGNTIVDTEDHRIWVEELKFTYFGDSNLDGQFSTDDLVEVFRDAKYESESLADWASGDWNADGKFNSRDFVIAWQSNSFENGPRKRMVGGAVPIPEPSFEFLTVTAICSSFLALYRKR
jgi:hypothetical protein